jgi:hypothetical protein
MSLLRSILPFACVAMLAACNPAAPGGEQKAADAGGAASGAAAPASCDAPAQPLAIGASAHGEIPAGQSYPDNARYFCVQVGEGVSSVTFELSGMSTDLDLYVGSGTIGSVQGVNLQEGDTYEWKSNAFGNDNEVVTINDPQPGIYYAEVVSYQGEQSGFDFAAR